MMIFKISRYTPMCDRCGAELPTVESFSDALSAIEDAGWLSVPPEKGNGVNWEHYCTECRARWDYE